MKTKPSQNEAEAHAPAYSIKPLSIYGIKGNTCKELELPLLSSQLYISCIFSCVYKHTRVYEHSLWFCLEPSLCSLRPWKPLEHTTMEKEPHIKYPSPTLQRRGFPKNMSFSKEGLQQLCKAPLVGCINPIEMNAPYMGLLNRGATNCRGVCIPAYMGGSHN